jgi:hypothetical protein
MVGVRPKKAKRRIPVSRWLLVAQFLALALAIWLVCAEWAPLAVNDSPIRLVGKAFLYLTLAWVGAFGMTLWTYMAISLDETRDLVRAAMRAALHALWFVPALLLVNPPADRGVALIGMLVMVNAARLVVSNPPPQRRLLSRRKWRTTHRLFGEARIQRSVFSKESIPAIVGAVALQIGGFSWWLGYPQWASPMFAAGVACWTWVSITRGAYLGHRRIHVVHRVMSVMMVVLFAIAFTVVRVDLDTGATGGAAGNAVGNAPGSGNAPGPGWLDATRQEMQSLINPPPPPKAAAATTGMRGRAPTRLVTATLEPDQLGKDGIPGLILQPGKKRPQALNLPPMYKMQVTLNPRKPTSIPFTGEYHLFRESSANIPPGSVQRPGSPMDAIYVTTNGTPMETDAYQDFDPPVDFAPCAKIKLTLTSGEVFPASATIILVGAEKVGEMGPEIFGMSSDPEETLEFTVPPGAAGLPVKGIRIIFRHNPMEASHSTQVAIQRFTFVPKGM